MVPALLTKKILIEVYRNNLLCALNFYLKIVIINVLESSAIK